MEDKHQLLGQETQPVEAEAEKEQGSAISPGHSPYSPDSRTARSADFNKCRECLGATAHRLAQPMTALRGGLELGLLGKHSAADYRALIEQSLQLADHMAQLIVSLRELGESGGPGGPTESLMLDVSVAEALTQVEALAQSRDIRLQFDAQQGVEIRANPERLREALENLLAWIIQNSAGGVIAVELSTSESEACLTLSPPRRDLQYLQIKVLEDIAIPGMLFSQAAKNGVLGWAINQHLLQGQGGRLEILAEGVEAGCIRVCFPLAPAS